MGATAAGSAAYQGVSSVGNGYIQASALRAQAQNQTAIAQMAQDRQNFAAGQSDRAAADAVKRGGVAANDRAEQGRQAEGVAKAQAAAEGGAGSAAEQNAVSQVESLSAADQATIKTNAFREAYGLQSQAISQRAEGTADVIKARMNSNQLDYMAKSSMITGWSKAVGYGAKGASDYSKNKSPSNNYAGTDDSGGGGYA